MFVPHVLGRFAVKVDTVLAGVSKKRESKRREQKGVRLSSCSFKSPSFLRL